MKHRMYFRNFIVLALTLLLAIPAIGIVFAQSTDAAPFLGITFETADVGIVVTAVVAESGAAQAGFAAGDIIVALNGEDANVNVLTETVRSATVGDALDFTLERDGESLDLSATLGERPQPASPRIEIRQRGVLGINVQETDAGVVVVDLTNNSSAAEAGVQVDDVITGINGTEVNQVSEIIDVLAELEAGDEVTLDIVRDGETLTLDVVLGGGLLDGDSGLRIPEPLNGRGFGIDIGIMYNSETQNWEISRLGDDSLLAEAGLHEGDTITAFDGEALDPAGLRALLVDIEDDVVITVTVERDGEVLDIEAPASAFNRFGILGGFNFDDNRIPFEGDFGARDFIRPRQVQLGVAFVTLNADVASERRIDTAQGALITEILADTPAEDAGLQVDDIVMAVAGDVVDEERTLRDRLVAFEAGDVVTLTILRDGETIDLDVTLADVEFVRPAAFNFFGPDGQLFLPDGFEFPEGLDLPNGFEFRFFGPDSFEIVPEAHADV